jgi:hypothetical protein
MAVGARETREGRAGGAESEEAGEDEAAVLCGYGWDWKGRGSRRGTRTQALQGTEGGLVPPDSD